MEPSVYATITNGHLPPSSRHDTDALPNDAVAAYRLDHSRSSLPNKIRPAPDTTAADADPSTRSRTVSRDPNQQRSRPEEEERHRSYESVTNMASMLVSRTVAPFLKEHIPGNYAPIGKTNNEHTARDRNPNTKTCYRHRPDSKCRRAADEAKMDMIQKELDKLPSKDKQAVTHVWSLFSAAPSRHRELMLQGIMSQLCFPQLSLISREAHEYLKIDPIMVLPVEISQKILCYLDTVSLTKAAQVSRQWRELADDDAVWVRMCEQHVNRKCTKCGWGLPLLERKKLRNYTRQRQLAKSNSNGRVQELDDSYNTANGEALGSAAGKRQCDDFLEGTPEGKRQRMHRANGHTKPEAEPKMRSWKAVYRDRWQVGYNWKYGRCSIKILRGHTNGVTCLQLDDTILASGSYDGTIKIWNIETGAEIRTLRGHQEGIRALQFDDSKLISAGLDHTVKIWNWHTGECLSTLQGHTSGVISVHFEGKLLASGSMDKSVRIFNFETKESFCLRGHSDWVNCTRLDMSSRTVLSASDDTTIKLWDLETKQVIRTFEGHVGHVQQVMPLPLEYEPDDELLANDNTNDNTDAVSVSSGRGGTPTLSFSQADRASTASNPHEDDIRSLYGKPFATDCSRPLPPRYFMTGGLDSTIRLWDSATGRCLKTMFGHLEGVWSLAGDTIRAISGANDGMVKSWEPRSGKCDSTFTGHRGAVTCVGLSDSRMASGGDDYEVRIYSFKDVPNGSSDAGTPR